MASSSISYSNIWKIALPIIISGLAQNIVTVIDTLFLSQVGVVELGAVGNGGIFYFLIVTIGLGFTTGTQILVAKNNGAKNYKEIGTLLEQSFYFILPLSLILFALFQIGYPYLSSLLSKSTAITNASVEFVSYRSFGVLFALINFLFIAFFVGIKKTSVLLWSSVVIAVTNITLDYGLIFGNFGLPLFGVKGAAIASVLAELSAVIFFVFYSKKQVNLSKYNFRFTFQLKTKLIKDTLRLSSPIMLQNILTFGSWFVFFSIIEQIGEDELAISHVIRSIYMIMMIPLLGFSTAIGSLVSNLLGEGKQEFILKLLTRTLLLTLVSSSVVVLLTTVFKTQIVGFYQLSAHLEVGTFATLKVVSFSLFFFSIAFVLFNAIVGLGKTKESLVIETVNIALYLATAIIWVRYYSPSVDQIWYTEFVYFSSLALMSFLYLRFGNWKKEV